MILTLLACIFKRIVSTKKRKYKTQDFLSPKRSYIDFGEARISTKKVCFDSWRNLRCSLW